MTVIDSEIKIERHIRTEMITGNGRGHTILFPCDMTLTNDPRHLLILTNI